MEPGRVAVSTVALRLARPEGSRNPDPGGRRVGTWQAPGRQCQRRLRPFPWKGLGGGGGEVAQEKHGGIKTVSLCPQGH
jgi:hypothetical protein